MERVQQQLSESRSRFEDRELDLKNQVSKLEQGKKNTEIEKMEMKSKLAEKEFAAAQIKQDLLHKASQNASESDQEVSTVRNNVLIDICLV